MRHLSLPPRPALLSTVRLSRIVQEAMQYNNRSLRRLLSNDGAVIAGGDLVDKAMTSTSVSSAFYQDVETAVARYRMYLSGQIEVLEQKDRWRGAVLDSPTQNDVALAYLLMMQEFPYVDITENGLEVSTEGTNSEAISPAFEVEHKSPALLSDSSVYSVSLTSEAFSSREELFIFLLSPATSISAQLVSAETYESPTVDLTEVTVGGQKAFYGTIALTERAPYHDSYSLDLTLNNVNPIDDIGVVRSRHASGLIKLHRADKVFFALRPEMSLGRIDVLPDAPLFCVADPQANRVFVEPLPEAAIRRKVTTGNTYELEHFIERVMKGTLRAAPSAHVPADKNSLARVY